MTPEQYERISEEEYLQFERIPQERRFSNRPDLNAFILLDKLIPGTLDIVSGVKHYEFFLSINPEELAKVATEEQVTDLIRSGARYDSLRGCLAMFT